MARVLYLRSFRDVILTPAWAAAIVQWNRQRLPSCGPGLEFQAQHQCFFQFKQLKLEILRLDWNVKKDKKWSKIWPGLDHLRRI